ncbi:lipase [Paenibacillus sp. PK3_47]|uniref:lipase family protein n=1 Tax=Paenibacillus sp. PK3_47 TaxID=2072642 RepID=UPI00201DEAAF|nr:lipase family protein [Paenibacillus sp. PK3_47]UQZ32212.1 lipase [Paenibacillus sp. PK3_47]
MQVGNNKDMEQRAIFLAAVCGQTYAQFTHTDGSFVVPLHYSLCHTIEARSMNSVWEVFGFIIESPEEVIIAFRGTSSTSNWVSNMNASQKNFKYIKEACLTHRGFTDIYASARDGIISVLGSLSPEKALFVTGHSLGGALAALCAVDAAANTHYRFPSLYTYGAPRTGDPDFAKAAAKYVPHSFRIANPFDLVTYVPPSIYKLPKRSKKYYYTHNQTRYPLSFQNGAVPLNHMIGSYYAALAKLQPEFAELLRVTNPGLCPIIEVKPAQTRTTMAE